MYLWPVPGLAVAGTCFPTQNVKPGMYLRPGRSQVPVFPPKIWSRAYTWDRYLTWRSVAGTCRRIPATGTCFLTQNMKPGMYLRPGRSQLTKICGAEVWPVAGTCFLTQNMKPRMYLRPVPDLAVGRRYHMRRRGLAGRRYLFSHPKYEAAHVPETGTWPGGRSPVPVDVYLPPVPVFSPKIWSRACTWGLAGRS